MHVYDYWNNCNTYDYSWTTHYNATMHIDHVEHHDQTNVMQE